MIYSTSTVNQKMNKKLGSSFGQTAFSYAFGRKAYPDCIFELFSEHSAKNMTILELGCGTGLATKQLYEKGFTSLVATDVDPLMLKEARNYCPEVSLQLADANTLPFFNQSFDSIALFGCFHWFCTCQAINEIKRVLKQQGIVFVVNKQDTGHFRKCFVQFLQDVCNAKVEEGKANYKPQEKLIQHGFSVCKHTFVEKELFTNDDLLAYCQSISLWASLPKEKRKKHLPALRHFLSDIMDGKYFERSIDVQCFVAHMP